MPFRDKMKSIRLKLLLLLFSFIIHSLTQQTIYVDNSNTKSGSDGTLNKPFLDLDHAFKLMSSKPGNYIVEIAPTNTTYQLTVNNKLTGVNFTLQTMNLANQIGSYLSKSDSCSKLAQIGLDKGVITANSFTFNGLNLITSSNLGNSISFSGTQFTIMNSCFQIDSLTQSDSYIQTLKDYMKILNKNSGKKSQTTSISINDPPLGIQGEYILIFNPTTLSNLTLSNIIITGVIISPPLISANNIDQLLINNMNSSSFPRISAITGKTNITGLFIDGSNNYQSQAPFNITAYPCFTKISYYSQMNIKSFNINNLNVTGHPYYLCSYEVSTASDATNKRNFLIDGFTFQNNNMNITTDWSLLYLVLANNDVTIFHTVKLSNLNVISNKITMSDSTYSDNFLFDINSPGDLQITNVLFNQNTDLKFITSSFKNGDLSSSLSLFKDLQFLGNTWQTGNEPVSTISVNPNISLSQEIPTVISSIRFESNINLINFFSLTNIKSKDDSINSLLGPRASISNVTVKYNQINTSSVFTIQLFTVDFNDSYVTQNSFISSNLFQGSQSPSSLLINNLTVETNNFTDSNIIFKHFDASKIIESFATDSDNNMTPIPYTLYIQNFI